MKIVYISYPFRDKNINKVHQNIAEAIGWGILLQSVGFAPLVPHVNIAALWTTKGANTYGLLDKEIVAFNFALLKICDLIYVPNGVVLTKGMKEEIKFCKKHKIPIMTEDDLAIRMKKLKTKK